MPSPHAFTCSGYATTVPALSAIARSVCATTVTTAIPVPNVKARANTKAIFFMIVSPLSVTLLIAEKGKVIRDNRHVLGLFNVGCPTLRPCANLPKWFERDR